MSCPSNFRDTCNRRRSGVHQTTTTLNEYDARDRLKCHLVRVGRDFPLLPGPLSMSDQVKGSTTPPEQFSYSHDVHGSVRS